ncbi:MAG: BMP family ABC transporter substrate-binding protein [Lachnospiraceae bacterium]|nr:BMP family ABC transporter substrate-binding protein [Lachnospiraceae bacterium]
MSKTDYEKARKLAQKAYRIAPIKGTYPYLQVLDDILSYTKVVSEVDLGLVEVPLDLIAGTKTAGRTQAFANNFMPLLPESSEFAVKWIHLYESHLEEGIRDPIIAYEFMNRFYVVEGNKRVSVLKYAGAVSVHAYVTRVIPQRSDDKDVKIYYEFLDFYRLTSLNDVWFSQEGSYQKLLKLLEKDPDRVWSHDERLDFHSSYIHFTDVFEEKGGHDLPLTPGDAFLSYLDVYGYQGLWEKPSRQILKELEKLWPDLEIFPGKPPKKLVMQPEKEHSRSVISQLLPVTPTILKIAFLHDKTKEISSWTYGHELGRLHLNEVFSERVQTTCYDNINSEELGLKTIDEAVDAGYKVIFTTTPKLLGASIKAAIKYPEIKILNCSLNAYSGHLRTYYGRLYEAKFLTGALAGILSETHKVGYLADYPIYGMTANINAFALGVQMTNPKAKVYLEWSTVRDCNPEESFRSRNISYISGQDLITPQNASRKFGLYDIQGEEMVNVAASIWHWGKFYERIVHNILNGAWKKEPVGNQRTSINYWWGISSGMIDVICTKNIPSKTQWLIELLKKEIAAFHYNPFSGSLYAQDGTLKSKEGEELTPEEIISMDWLLHNVEGAIPTLDMLIEEARPMMKLQGIGMAQELG